MGKTKKTKQELNKAERGVTLTTIFAKMPMYLNLKSKILTHSIETSRVIMLILPHNQDNSTTWSVVVSPRKLSRTSKGSTQTGHALLTHQI